MKSRLGKYSVSEKVLRGLWLERLPKSVMQIITPMTRATLLDDLAVSADLVLAQFDYAVNAVHTPETTRREQSGQSAANKALADLQRQVREIQISLRQRRRRRTPSQQQRRQTPNRESRNNQDLCWFHRTFGNDATNCRPLCKHPSVWGSK